MYQAKLHRVATTHHIRCWRYWDHLCRIHNTGTVSRATRDWYFDQGQTEVSFSEVEWVITNNTMVQARMTPLPAYTRSARSELPIFSTRRTIKIGHIILHQSSKSFCIFFILMFPSKNCSDCVCVYCNICPTIVKVMTDIWPDNARERAAMAGQNILSVNVWHLLSFNVFSVRVGTELGPVSALPVSV